MKGTDIKEFKDLEFKSRAYLGGLQCNVSFDSGYGVSIINGVGSYGYPDLWEVAITYEGSLTYETHITDDVLGWQTEHDVIDVINKVKALK